MQLVRYKRSDHTFAQSRYPDPDVRCRCYCYCYCYCYDCNNTNVLAPHLAVSTRPLRYATVHPSTAPAPDYGRRHVVSRAILDAYHRRHKPQGGGCRANVWPCPCGVTVTLLLLLLPPPPPLLETCIHSPACFETAGYAFCETSPWPQCRASCMTSSLFCAPQPTGCLPWSLDRPPSGGTLLARTLRTYTVPAGTCADYARLLLQGRPLRCVVPHIYSCTVYVPRALLLVQDDGPNTSNVALQCSPPQETRATCLAKQAPSVSMAPEGMPRAAQNSRPIRYPVILIYNHSSLYAALHSIVPHSPGN
jgi:hypothetical protein